MIDWSIHFGNIVEILILLGVLIGAFVRIQMKVHVLHSDLITIKDEVKKLREVMIQMAVSDQRIKSLESEIFYLKNKKER